MNKGDSMFLGVVMGLISPAITFMGYYLINYNYMTFRGFINYLILGKTYSPLISLCVVTNLLVFFIFIWKEDYRTTKGILLSTFIYAAWVFYLKLFT